MQSLLTYLLTERKEEKERKRKNEQLTMDIQAFVNFLKKEQKEPVISRTHSICCQRLKKKDFLVEIRILENLYLLLL